jgi:Transposase DDE domain
MNKSTKASNEDKALLSFFSLKFAWHLSHLKLLSMLVSSLLKVQHVGLGKLSSAFVGCTEDSSSSYRRVQRFFSSFKINMDAIAKLLFSMCPQKINVTLAIDRTNWQFGKLDINIFMLSICCDGISFPILWQMLPKKGNSNSQERIDLIARFIKLFGKDCIAALTADREFIGGEWLQFLEQQRIAYYIRIRNNMWFTTPNGKRLKMSWVLQSIPINQIYRHSKLLYLDNVLVYVEAMKLQKGEMLIIVSFKQNNAIEIYKDRWQIETLFKAFKTKGFNIEDTHLNQIDRIDKLVAVVAIAYAWAYKVGEYVHNNIKKIAIKTHQRRAFSILKYGLNYIASTLLTNNLKKYRTIFKVLSCT